MTSAVLNKLIRSAADAMQTAIHVYIQGGPKK